MHFYKLLMVLLIMFIYHIYWCFFKLLLYYWINVKIFYLTHNYQGNHIIWSKINYVTFIC